MGNSKRRRERSDGGVKELTEKVFDKEGRLSEIARDTATVLEGGRRLMFKLKTMSKKWDDKKKRGG